MAAANPATTPDPRVIPNDEVLLRLARVSGVIWL